MEKIDDPIACKKLIEAYQKLDYYGQMYDVAMKKINALTVKMSWNDIKYCIERTTK